MKIFLVFNISMCAFVNPVCGDHWFHCDFTVVSELLNCQVVLSKAE